MLVISGVNRRGSLGKGWGLLHELPDQQAMIATLCRLSPFCLAAMAMPSAAEIAPIVSAYRSRDYCGWKALLSRSKVWMPLRARRSSTSSR